MKKTLAAMLAALVAVSAFSQTNQRLRVRNVEYEKDNKSFDFHVTMDYPNLENCLYAEAIQEWINESMGGDYSGSLRTPEGMLDFYFRQKAKEYAEFWDEDMGMQSEESYRFKLEEETDVYVTYLVSVYSYTAGTPHGNGTETAVSFRKKDGRRFGWNMFTAEGKRQLRPIIASRLRSKYGNDAFFEVPDASNANFELPFLDPYISKGKVVFTYPPYEIAPYVEGTITVEIPFSSVKGMLNATGQNFL